MDWDESDESWSRFSPSPFSPPLSVLMADPYWREGFYYHDVPPHTGMKVCPHVFPLPLLICSFTVAHGVTSPSLLPCIPSLPFLSLSWLARSPPSPTARAPSGSSALVASSPVPPKHSRSLRSAPNSPSRRIWTTRASASAWTTTPMHG